MPLTAKTVRNQLERVKPLLAASSIESQRKGQELLGALMGLRQRRQVIVKEHPFAGFSGAWVIPKDERRQGVILYLHGGGYVCGGVEYAKGVGSALADWTGSRVFCCAYRLAPEHRFPAAVEDALESYRYLLDKGYDPRHICLCGESAGGGLCFSLCLKLKELSLPMPGGVIAVSPWTDLTQSGRSYEENQNRDPSMTAGMLHSFAAAYTGNLQDPLASPLFGDLCDLPPSLLLVGGDEIMLSDTTSLQEKLIRCGCHSELIVAPERWHGYVLYGLEEDQKDRKAINLFLDRHVAPAKKLRWMRLDNAAKIYPAARRQNWSSMFRLSVTLQENIDVAVMQTALDVTVRRFPSIAARLRRGLFWYYLQELERAPSISRESSYPLTRMSYRETRACAFRVIVYENRVAVELFHSLTDGNGGMIFLKSLVAEYLQQKYGVRIPPEQGVHNRLEEPNEREMADCFPKYAGAVAADRKENTAWRLSGTPEQDGFLNITCFTLSVRQALERAHSYGVSLSVFLAAVMLQSLQTLQARQIPDIRKRKPLKVLLPVDLRRVFPEKETLRNFALYTTPELLPRLGEYSFREICDIVHHWIRLDVTPKQMSMKIATNVRTEQQLPVKLLPLFIKNFVMRAAFILAGEKKSSLCFSNLGAVQLPEAMQPYVNRMDFILGTQATAPYNCGIVSYGDQLQINFTRNIRESHLEYAFYRALQAQNLQVQVQSNAKQEV